MQHLDSAFQTLDTYAKEIINLKDNLNDDFNQVIELILACQGRIVVAGIGKSGIIGHKIVATLASTGTPSLFLHPTEAFHGDLGMLKPEDIVMLISNSGETDDVNKLIPSLKNFGNKIIAMTGNINSTLAKHADLVLNIHIQREACPNNLAPTTSALVTLALGDALAIALIKARNFQPHDFAKYHPGGNLGRRLLCRVRDVMQTELPTVQVDDSFIECLNVMNQGRKGVALAITDNKLLGIITDGDIRRTLSKYGDASLQLKVKEFMTSQPLTISEVSYLAEAEQFMKEKKVHSLVVLAEQSNIPVGIVEFAS